MHLLLSLMGRIPFISLSSLFIFSPFSVCGQFGCCLLCMDIILKIPTFWFACLFVFYLFFSSPSVIHLCKSEEGRDGRRDGGGRKRWRRGVCQSPKERLLQLESIFALGISITGLQSSASLIMDGHMALLTHTALRLALPPPVLLLPITGLSFVLNFSPICFRNSACCIFFYSILFSF